ncbi:DUF2321 domain-containing protein [Clostridium botulinum]|uniref:DUF2321 domain-containing protein n=1 Tax=unclassified Clostridium TaxID=2614128 RepID=UPI0013CB10E0|nr:DUF2321 domain-containing protein [Clostridium botulinum]NFH73850.1 DUF2321 domain-containing protein [Clostridium botulinum]NFI02103.1 DUF2321 domain-containing protein [Clostridium botulinum]NFI64294.1 DUF2321 domain-containing protein [Clostridium botulinum]NFJ45087.1 DUF2321 domain-containing protein [Clostridium botulinum]
MGYYHIAQICENGHLITGSIDTSPELSQNICGAKTLTKCPNCNKNIKGNYEVEGVAFLGSTIHQAPSYCPECGEPYPWTKNALDATKELLTMDSDLDEAEIQYLSENMNSLLSDTPKTKVVATKFKLALKKVSITTASAIKDILVDIASEAAKKIIFPQ